MATDEELVTAFRESGDKTAADELLRRHSNGVRAMTYQMVLDDASADDVTQETFFRAFRGLSSFQGRSRFSTWLYKVALNTTYRFLERQNRSAVEFRSNVPDCPDSPGQRPDRAAMQTELEGEIEAAIAALSPPLRAAIVLTSLQSLNVKEAAEIEGCSRAAMYWRIHEARKWLKRKLTRYLEQ